MMDRSFEDFDINLQVQTAAVELRVSMMAPAGHFPAGTNAVILIDSSLIQIYDRYLPPSLLTWSQSLPRRLLPAPSRGKIENKIKK